MHVLVANLGSTSFKYSLFDIDDETVLAKGRIERIGEAESPVSVEVDGKKQEAILPVPDHAVAVQTCLNDLRSHFGDDFNIAAIGFKTVHAAGISGVQLVDEKLLQAMEEFNEVLPAHNPPYVNAMRLLRNKLPEIPLVAAFETGFHQTIPNRQRYYGVPFEWAEKYHIQKWGFHGASHRYISVRTPELFVRHAGKLPEPFRMISMHLGGSSSLCAIKDGKSVAASMGTSPQTGLFQNNRCGDFDPFIVPYLMRKMNVSYEEVLKQLSSKSGLLGLSGIGSDLRDIMNEAKNGNERAQLALDVFAGSIRQYLGAYMLELGGVDALVFTAGIGENNEFIREQVCKNLESFGIVLDEKKNAEVRSVEAPIHSPESKTQIWVIPTNEELVVARQVKECLSAK
ncbi:MAG: acetate/propionate family kinase [Planctomycetaceae bacterium]|nr:acetate/propionate family kinase [Planctomycetaceae bacterium]